MKIGDVMNAVRVKTPYRAVFIDGRTDTFFGKELIDNSYYFMGSDWNLSSAKDVVNSFCSEFEQNRSGMVFDTKAIHAQRLNKQIAFNVSYCTNGQNYLLSGIIYLS
jgi:hypothetical protein